MAVLFCSHLTHVSIVFVSVLTRHVSVADHILDFFQFVLLGHQKVRTSHNKTWDPCGPTAFSNRYMTLHAKRLDIVSGIFEDTVAYF